MGSVVKHNMLKGRPVYHSTEAFCTKTQLHTAQHISQGDKKYQPSTYSIYFTIYSLINDTVASFYRSYYLGSKLPQT